MKVKYDGYRIRLERDGYRVRLITRGGYNLPTVILGSLRRRKIRQKRFVLDGEAVILGFDGVSDFDALHSRKHDHEVQFCAFDIRAGRRDDLRKLPLSLRKTNLERLLGPAVSSWAIEALDQGEEPQPSSDEPRNVGKFLEFARLLRVPLHSPFL